MYWCIFGFRKSVSFSMILTMIKMGFFYHFLRVVAFFYMHTVSLDDFICVMNFINKFRWESGSPGHQREWNTLVTFKCQSLSGLPFFLFNTFCKFCFIIYHSIYNHVFRVSLLILIYYNINHKVFSIPYNCYLREPRSIGWPSSG